MLKRRIAVIVPLLTIATIAPMALASGGLSGTYSTKITKPASIKGTWKVKFAAGVDTVYLNGKQEAGGTYRIAGSTITFKKPAAKSGCHKPGKYSFTLSGKTLKFTKISDPCPNRPEILSHTFTKV
jgi:hypothetical protein